MGDLHQYSPRHGEYHELYQELNGLMMKANKYVAFC